ncbi:Epothilone C/D epoxidase [BD1-7 clade bacterium]|uniref:Epothilone C/D epoxidase n=1 Tax=BD1-7 clade bacterium TaxID=2029982 RepID=A0A5S9PHP4_9GAMM|nr:Epothilone C/D epoxidase [BD1-7 clade bacterium]
MLRLKITDITKIAFYMIKGAITRPRYSAFDPKDLEGFIRNPQPVYEDMLQNHSVFFAPTQLAWILTPEYKQYRELLTHSDLTFNFNAWDYFPTIPDHKMKELDRICESALPRLKPENHRRLRKIANKAFAPRFVKSIEANIESIVDRSLDSVDDVFDMDSLLENLTFEILAEYIGVPADVRHDCEQLYLEIIKCFLDPLDTPDYENSDKGITALKALIQQKKTLATDDFLSELVNACEDGDMLSEMEVLGLIATLLAVGPDTIRDNMAYFFYNMAKNPEALQRVVENPSLIDNAIYESMRWNASGYCGNTRFAQRDFEFHGQKIKKGEMIKIMANAAFYDPNEFPNPDVFDLDRDNVTDIPVYGGGPHYCLGHALATSAMRIIALRTLAYFPRYRLVEEPAHELNSISRRMKTLMIDVSESRAIKIKAA